MYVDSKDIAPADLGRRPQPGGHAEFGCDLWRRRLSEEKAATLNAALKIMPEAYSAATLEKLLGELKPRVAAFDAEAEALASSRRLAG